MVPTAKANVIHNDQVLEIGTMVGLDVAFEAALSKLATGFSTGRYLGLRYGVTVVRSADARRISVFARELGGSDIVSFNLYRMKSGEDALRPCEMSSAKVVQFVKGYVVDAGEKDATRPSAR